MDILKLILFLIFTLSSHIHVTTSASCNTHSFCGNLSFPITYPFQLLNNPQQKSNYTASCPYQPGFGLTCNILESKLIINLPYSGNFYVKNINYPDRTISLVDDCLPKRLKAKSLSLLSSPFVATYYEDFRLFSCPPYTNIRPGSGYTYVPCMSNSNVSVVAAKYYYSLPTEKCNESWLLSRVPGVQSSNYYYKGSVDEISLTWENFYQTANCYDANYCADINPDRPTSKGKESASNNGYMIMIPFVLVVSLTLTILWCKKSYSWGSSEVEAGSQNTATTVRRDLTAARPTPPNEGLHESIIEMCSTKLIIGESFRELFNSDYYSKLCAICLSDFSPKETIRCIVECQHYYHADCIEEWLRIKCSCPVCRNPLK